MELSTETTMGLVEFLMHYEPFWEDYYRGLQAMGRSAKDTGNALERERDVRMRSLHNTGENFMLNYVALKHALKLWSAHQNRIDPCHLQALSKAGVIDKA